MKKSFILLVAICSSLYISANNPVTIRQVLNWSAQPLVHNPTGQFPTYIHHFEGAVYDGAAPTLPVFTERFPLSSPGELSIEVRNTRFEPLNIKPENEHNILSEDIRFNVKVEQERRQYFGRVSFIPIRKIGSRYEKLVSFEIVVSHLAKPIVSDRGPTGTQQSVLADGDIYKIAVPTSGIYQINAAFLEKELNIDLSQVDPRNLKLYGNGGGPLPYTVDDPREDDLVENAIDIIGEDDGSFDNGDLIRFYAKGPHKWSYNESQQKFKRQTNVYDDYAYYFIKISPGKGKRITVQNSASNPDYTATSFNDYIRYEVDKYNLLSEAQGAQGSGLHWYGDVFNTTREKTFDFEFPNIDPSATTDMELVLAARSESSSSFNVEVAGNVYRSSSMASVRLSDNESIYARAGKVVQQFQTGDEDISVKVSYPLQGSGTNKGWLDYIELNTRRQLIFSGDQMIFRDVNSLDYESTAYRLQTNSSDLTVWNITNPLAARLQEVNVSGNTIEWATTGKKLHEFIAFSNQASFDQPVAIGRVENQNIHGISEADMLIIYHPDFAEAAQRLADHRRNYSGLTVATARIDQIFNEFSSGAQDPTAIRDLNRLLLERDANFNFILLIGDGSFDYRNVYGYADDVEKNFIPVFETPQSLDPINSFPSDDYFALLSPGEGAQLQGAVDVSVGRLPVNSSAEAMGVVEKIIRYESAPRTMRDWRNRVTFVADDEDGNLHIDDADEIATLMGRRYPDFNISKIFLDAYQQESTPGGARFPKANEAINRDMFRGALVLNYIGHGGSKGWAQERVLTLPDIESWRNADAMPLFVTATCSFTGYDEPSITSAGERSFIKPEGGVIGLFTTVRAVYASQNRRITDAVFDTLFGRTRDGFLPLGEILKYSKNKADVTNSRKFTLIGDPAMRLAIPDHKVFTTQINTHPLSTGYLDTLGALQKVTVKGFVGSPDSTVMNGFNGKVFPTVFDKVVTVSTLQQDSRSYVKNFKVQRNVLFKGVASVTNGQFEFTFVMPKDIDYQYGRGKISYYATDENDTDAHGYTEQFMIGGAAPNAVADDQGPLVEVFMNSEDFVFGGQTADDPTLLVKLSDDNGINVAGNSIGHDLTGVLDANTQSSYILNDFYEAELDDYTKGMVRYPLFDLAPGLHQIRVKAWDIANNSSEGYTEFVVAEDGASALAHVLNYPNPFTTSTNFQFEYNQTAQPLDVQVQIFTVGGRLVKTLEDQLFNDGGAIRLPWDGRDDYGDRLGRGVYIYKIKVQADGIDNEKQKVESDFERLVILK